MVKRIIYEETKDRVALVSLIVILSNIVFAFMFGVKLTSAETSSTINNDLVEKTLNLINMENVISHVKFFSSLNRTTGYPGCEEAAKYIYDYFKNKLGFQTWIEEFKVAVPMDHGSYVTVLRPAHHVIKAYTIEPNHIQTCKTPKEGIEGSLLYVEDGKIDKFIGRVNGSIILMDFNSGENWLNAMRLGAKGVIFIEPTQTIRSEADRKSIDVPVKFPRLYVSREDGDYLKDLIRENKDVIVKINVNMTWEEVSAKNIIAVVEGTDPNEKDAIVVTAYYDAASVVPAIAPGADESNGIAALLEFGRTLKEFPPRRPVWLIAFSGHTQAMAGVRDFIWHNQTLIGYEPDGRPKYFIWHYSHVGRSDNETMAPHSLKMAFSLDFSTDSSALAVIAGGTFYGISGPWPDWHDYKGTLTRLFFVEGRYGKFSIVRGFLGEGTFEGIYYIGSEELRNKLGSRHHNLQYRVFGIVYDRQFLPFPVNTEASVFAQTGTWGISFYTAMSPRLYYNTPLNTFDKVDFRNLAPQVELAFILLRAATNDLEYFDFSKAKIGGGQKLIDFFTHKHKDESGIGFAVVKGNVLRWDMRENWYVSDWANISGKDGQLLLHVSIVSPRDLYGHTWIQFAEADGSFVLKGLAPSHPWAARQYQYRVLPFLINKTTGDIEYAPDFGIYGTRLWPFGCTFFTFEDELVDGSGIKRVNLVMFKAGTIALHDLIDPRSLLSPFVSRSLKIFIHETDVEPISYSYLISEPPSYENPGGSTFIGDPTSSHDAILFVPGDIKVKIIFFGDEESPLGILTNMERGISVKAGQYVDFSPTALYFAKDLLFITEERITNLRKERVFIGPKTAAEENYARAKSLLLEAEHSLKNNRYAEYYVNVLMAWYYARNAYVETKKSIIDSIVTVIFFFILMLPASLSLERLVFHREGKSRIISLILIFTISTLVLYILHPGFRLASNSGMVALGFVILVLAAPIPIIMFKDIFDTLKEIREKIVGIHFIDVARIGIVFKTFSIGVENLRKNAFRSFLTLLSITLVTLSLTAFTSVSPIWVMVKSPPPMQTAMQWEPRYEGILITRTEINAPINPNLANLLRALYGEKVIVAPRAFLPASNTHLYNASTGMFRLSGILGFSPEEAEILRLQDVILPGALMPWFDKSSFRVCYISEDVARSLKVNPGDDVFLFGIKLKVLGIIDQSALQGIYDIDGQQITPLDPDKYIPPIPRVFWGLIFIPYDLSMSIGAVTVSVSLKFLDESLIEKAAQDLATYLSYYVHYVYVSRNKESYLYTPRVLFNVAGWEFTLIPFVLTAFLLTNIMLGAFHERARHILIYSTLGAAPSHVAFIFLSESIIYSLLGATIGYLIGLTIGTSFGSFVPGISANYTSIQIILAVILCISAVVSGSIYPIFRASKAVTPSFERSWKIPTKPKGLEWEISLPYLFEEPEARGVVVYIREFIKSYSSEATPFMVSDVKLNEEVEEEGKMFKLNLIVRLKPYERGVTEQVTLTAKPSKEGKYYFIVHAKLLAGPRQIWLRGHREVIDALRKQVLLWRALRSEERRRYMDMRWN